MLIALLNINIEGWLTTGGLVLLAAIVFAESGLLFGFFLPGDTLLFIAGFLSSKAGGNVLPALPITAGVVFVAAALGDQVGYWFGKRVGPSLFNRPESRFFKPANVQRAHEFFEKRGPASLVIARFVPVVRTFIPIVAGIGKMDYRKFITYNLIGAALWGVGVTTLGYFLGEIEFVKNNLEVFAVIVFLISIAPIVVEFIKSRKHRKQAAEGA